MIRNVSSYPEILRSWEDMLAAKVEDSSELADLQPMFDQLKAQLDRASELVTTQNNALSERQLAAKELKSALSVGGRMATILRKALMVRFGARSDKLVKYGIQPERPRRRIAKAPTEPKPEPTVPSSPIPSEPTQ